MVSGSDSEKETNLLILRPLNWKGTSAMPFPTGEVRNTSPGQGCRFFHQQVYLIQDRFLETILIACIQL